MADITVPAKGYAWGRNRDVGVSGLKATRGLSNPDFPGLEMVQLHPIDLRGHECWSSYISLNADALDAFAQAWLTARGYVVRPLEPQDDGYLPDRATAAMDALQGEGQPLAFASGDDGREPWTTDHVSLG